MKKNKIIAALLASVCVIAAGSCNGGSGGRPDTTTAANTTAPAETTTTTPAKTLNEEQKQAVEEIEFDLPELENKEVKLLACFDLNPDEGKVKGVALEMFETKLGGKIVTDKCGWGARYSKLQTYILADDAPDMFSAEDLDIIPGKVIAGAFQSMDPYIDYDSELWAPAKELNDQFSLAGKHYLGLTRTDVRTVLIYNKLLFEENGLEDPAQLVKEGRWDWDAMMDMFSKFCVSGEKYGLDCWEFEPDFALTCGVPYIGLENGKLVNNISSPMIQKVQDYFVKINRAEYNVPVGQREANPGNVGLCKTMFFGKGLYALYEPNTIAGLGFKDGDKADMTNVMFVPMPKCPDADAWYLPAKIMGYAIPTGAKNPEGTAAYLNCEMICRDNEKVKEIEYNQLFDDYGWTDELYEMLGIARELTDAHPVFDFMKTVNDTVLELVNNPSKKSYNEGTPWGESVDAISVSVQVELDAANDKLAKIGAGIAIDDTEAEG